MVAAKITAVTLGARPRKRFQVLSATCCPESRYSLKE
jgi:hypothetical protein